MVCTFCRTGINRYTDSHANSGICHPRYRWINLFRLFGSADSVLTTCGISSGKKQIKWHSVTKIETIGYGIHVYAANTKIVIAPWAYQDPEALISFIHAQYLEQCNKIVCIVRGVSRQHNLTE